MCGCERDRTNFAILNFSATVDLLKKRRKLKSTELLEAFSAFIRKIKHDREIYITEFVIGRVVSHALKMNNFGKSNFICLELAVVIDL